MNNPACILGGLNKSQQTTQNNIEVVEKEKHEIKLVDKFIRKKGLNLYAYDPIADTFQKVKTTAKKDARLIVSKNKKLQLSDESEEELIINSTHIYFEALKDKTAQKRINKYKAKIIPDLCNLRKPGNGIKFY